MEVELDARTVTHEYSYADGVKAGLLTVAPLLLAVAPFSVALAVGANAAGFGVLETTLMSVLVFAGAAQVAAVSLFSSGAGLAAIVLTTLLINLRHIIYGLSLDRHLPVETRPSRAVLAFMLIDEAWGLSMSEQAKRYRIDAFLFGASVGLYIPFVLFTAAGALFATAIPQVDRLGLEFIFPLAFVALLIPALRGMRTVAIAAVSGGLALVLLRVMDPGIAILLAVVVGASVGAVWKEST